MNIDIDYVHNQGYNELLYAHLLDSDGARLTYTHFTAKVNNDVIVILPVFHLLM